MNSTWQDDKYFTGTPSMCRRTQVLIRTLVANDLLLRETEVACFNDVKRAPVEMPSSAPKAVFRISRDIVSIERSLCDWRGLKQHRV